MRNKIVNPYNTETGQEPPEFVGRDIELRKFNRNLRDTAHGKPRYLGVIGDYGMGKTVLLWQFEKCVQKAGYYSIFVQSYTVSNFRDFYNLILNAVIRLLPREKINIFKARLQEVGLSIVGTGITMSLREKDFEPQSASSDCGSGFQSPFCRMAL